MGKEVAITYNSVIVAGLFLQMYQIGGIGALMLLNAALKIAHKLSKGLLICFKLAVLTWVYISVVRLLLCPNNSCM
jgi:hypothetical protein